MSIYPFLHPDRCLSYKFPTSVFPACEFPVTFSNALSASSLLMFSDTFPHIFPVTFSNALSASSLLMFFNAFSYTFSCSFLKCFSGTFTLYENCSSTPKKQAKTLTFIRLPFACSLPASLRFLQRPSPVLYRLRCAFRNGFRLFPSTSCLCFFPAFCFSIALFFFCFLFSLPYKIMHTIPPLLPFTIFCIVSCSFI